MAKYEVIEESYIGGRIVKAGEVIDFDGTPSSNLRAADSAAEKAFAEATKVPAAVQAVVNAARLHAAARGIDPQHANADDIAFVVDAATPKPQPAAVQQALALLSSEVLP